MLWRLCVAVVGENFLHSDVIKYLAVVLGGLLFTIATVVTVFCVASRRHKLSPGQYYIVNPTPPPELRFRNSLTHLNHLFICLLPYIVRHTLYWTW